MKKLLALILCVMLFVSVIPTGAFAVGPETEEAMMSLYEKFYGQTTDDLPYAYAQLGAAHVYANAVNGTKALLKVLDIKGDDAETIITNLKDALGGDLDTFINSFALPLLSPAALFSMVGLQLTNAMDVVGAAVVENAEGKVDDAIEDVQTAINNIAISLGEEAPF